MHRCLLIPELAYRIVEACEPDYKDQNTFCNGRTDRPGHSTLSALARTCHTLQDPALDVLWYNQFGVHRLLQVMPRELWETHECSIELGDEMHARRSDVHRYSQLRLTDIRDFVPSDWERFDFYARRVRKLVYRCFYRGWEDPSYKEPDLAEIERLCTSRGRPLIPNLQSLTWFGPSVSLERDRSNLTDHLWCFLSPTLLSLGLVSIPPAQLNAFSFSALPVHSPSLQCFHLTTSTHNLNTSQLRSVLHDLHNMKRFSLHLVVPDSPEAHTPLDADQLTGLPKLRALYIYAPQQHAPMAPGPDAQRAARHTPYVMDDLMDLTIHARHAGAAMETIRAFSLPSLEIVRLHTEGAAMFSVPSLLASRITSNSLQEFIMSAYIHCFRRERRLVEGSVVGYRQLKPLFVFHNLQRLDINLTSESGTAIGLTDDDWEAFSRAWPRLETVYVAGDENAESRMTVVRPTYKALAHLVRFCPHIKRVGFTIMDPPEPQDLGQAIDSLPVSSHAVNLNLYHSKLSNVEFTAMWVAKMFPRFKYIWKTVLVPRDPADPRTGNWRKPDGWSEVMQLARSYASSDPLLS